MLPPWLVFQRQRFMKPAGQIKQLHSRRALFCTTLAVHLMGALHLIEFLLFRRTPSVSWFHLNLLRLKLHPVRHTMFGPVMHLSFPLEHLQQACTSAEGMTQGKPTVLLFTFHPYSPLTHGCYRSELSTNQLSAHICPMSTSLPVILCSCECA